MTNEDLKKLAEAATGAPWTLLPASFSPRIYIMRKGYGSDDAAIAEVRDRSDAAFIAAAREAVPRLLEEIEAPIDMILHCPSCGLQHIDEPSEGWDNPPHRSHLCHGCGHIWRPADRATNGVAHIRTVGTKDSPRPLRATPAEIGAKNAEIERLRVAMAWTDHVQPRTLSAANGYGAGVEMTWDEFNGMRAAIGLRPLKPRRRFRAALTEES
jgi:hypothetical protein